MERLRSLARLPGSADTQPLAQRKEPYLRLPHHIGGDLALRDAAYRAILPEAAVYANRFLRRYAFKALVRRAQCEEEILRGEGQGEKARRWSVMIAKAKETYDDEVHARRDMYFRAEQRSDSASISCSSRAPSAGMARASRDPPAQRPEKRARLMRTTQSQRQVAGAGGSDA